MGRGCEGRHPGGKKRGSGGGLGVHILIFNFNVSTGPVSGSRARSGVTLSWDFRKDLGVGGTSRRQRQAFGPETYQCTRFPSQGSSK